MQRIVCALVGALALAGCSTTGGDDDEAGTAKKVVVATHESWAAPDELVTAFEKESGYDVEIVASGDAGQLTNKLVLTKESPIADAVYGIDNTFGSRAVDEGVLQPYRSADLPEGDYELDGEHLTPVDWGDVCVNVDDTWFARKKLAKPTSLDDLVKPAYRDLFVTSGAASSSPGFAFLLATIGQYGEGGWQAYWTDLMANGTKLTSGWSDSYGVDFTAGEGNGDRPIVLSYSSSPPFTIADGADKPTTSALLDTCFRQVEYAGVLEGAENPEGAKAFVDFLVSKDFQESLPDNMYVYPVLADAALPELWAKWAPASEHPIAVAPDEISENREAWLTEWSDITTR